MTHLSARDLQHWLQDSGRAAPLLLDVREPWEFSRCHIPGSQLVPMQQIPRRVDEMDPEADTVVICHHGVRSFHVGQYLEHAGFSRVYNLDGGVDRWARDVDPGMAIY